MTDQIIDPIIALDVQSHAAAARVLCAWIILHDCSGKFIARFATSHPTIYVMQADTLEGLRDQLPAGLERSDRQPADPPEVIEVWFADLSRAKP